VLFVIVSLMTPPSLRVSVRCFLPPASLSSHFAMAGCQVEIAHQPPTSAQTLASSPSTSTLRFTSTAEAAPVSRAVAARKPMENRPIMRSSPESMFFFRRRAGAGW
jgi:hypothetical protein